MTNTTCHNLKLAMRLQLFSFLLLVFFSVSLLLMPYPFLYSGVFKKIVTTYGQSSTKTEKGVMMTMTQLQKLNQNAILKTGDHELKR